MGLISFFEDEYFNILEPFFNDISEEYNYRVFFNLQSVKETRKSPSGMRYVEYDIELQILHNDKEKLDFENFLEKIWNYRGFVNKKVIFKTSADEEFEKLMNGGDMIIYLKYETYFTKSEIEDHLSMADILRDKRIQEELKDGIKHEKLDIAYGSYCTDCGSYFDYYVGYNRENEATHIDICCEICGDIQTIPIYKKINKE